MRNLLIIFLFIFLCLPSFAEYMPIPKELSKQYKNEIEQVIKTQVPIAKKNIDNVFKEVEVEKDKYEKILKIEYSMDGVLFDLYKVYFSEDGDTLSILFGALIPYIKDNKINASKIYSLIKYAQKRQKELEKKYNYQIELE